ncbi:ornithine cyclodeaminase family protein [Brevibacillus fulvus]|uniref:Ornithine cyclodeaminase/alanine dehydrogenase n=1 Tax=Brevibacillus fulvus TaxID=1125967 RepID=A0A938XYU1_9BACL|nr:ornithine cyclodeaminase family protein [Brevibacillus fulvus]MBM7590694.1 ornithine cyclodeaminase/alanine dehydrogenase [Brevibacillus fulvus]
MFPFRVVNQAAVEQILDMSNVIEVVEQAYKLKATDQATLFPLIFHEFEQGKADMDIKSGHLTGANVFGLKLVSWFGENSAKNLPQLIGMVMVLDSRTGVPLGILSGEHITCMRTGAAGAIGAKYLARKDSKHLLMIGSGHQAPFQIMATLMVMEQIEKVTIYNPQSHERAVAFAQSIQNTLIDKFVSKYKGDPALYAKWAKRCEITFAATDNIEAAAREADVIITATPSRKPLVKQEWIKPGTHFSCIGADMEGKQEIDENLFAGARLFVDDVQQAVNVGETELPIKKGVITPQAIVAEIGDVLLGKVPGRTSDSDITIFDSTGIALQDLLTATHILREAEQKGLGSVVDL